MYALRSGTGTRLGAEGLGSLRREAVGSTSRAVFAQSQRALSGLVGTRRWRGEGQASRESVQRYTAIFAFFRSLHTSSTTFRSLPPNAHHRLPTNAYPSTALSSPARPFLPLPTQGAVYTAVRGKKKKRFARQSWLYEDKEGEEDVREGEEDAAGVGGGGRGRWLSTTSSGEEGDVSPSSAGPERPGSTPDSGGASPPRTNTSPLPSATPTPLSAQEHARPSPLPPPAAPPTSTSPSTSHAPSPPPSSSATPTSFSSSGPFSPAPLHRASPLPSSTPGPTPTPATSGPSLPYPAPTTTPPSPARPASTQTQASEQAAMPSPAAPPVAAQGPFTPSSQSRPSPLHPLPAAASSTIPLPTPNAIPTSGPSGTATSSPGHTSSAPAPDPAPIPSPHTPASKQRPPPGPATPPVPQEEPAYLRFYPRHLRQLARSLPHIHLRPPSIDDILKVTTGFWRRLSVRFRWLTIRSFRRFTAEEYGTFFGWFVLSQTVWLLVGTTTFVGAVFFTLNSFQLQHYVARIISDYLTKETGWDITYENATVPRWRDATISFKNVYVSQKPKTYTATGEDGTTEERASWMTVNLDIDSIDVTLSLWRWLDGKGLVKNAVIKGVRGIMDRRNVYWDPERVYNPADFRHPNSPGAFELESLRIEDALVTVYQTKRFRPFFVSIYKADIGRFRRQWMFYDFISAESIVGQFDNCLFSVHKPQSVSRTRDAAMKEEGWKRLSRLRIDGVSIDHLKATLSSETGLWSWIQAGKVDAVLDIRFPSHPDDDNLDLSQIISNITAELAEQLDRIPGQRELARPALEVPGDLEESELAISEDLQGDTKQRKVEIDIDLRFRDLKAAVPIWTNELSYMNNALIRPIVAFINANRTLLPIRCRIVKDLSEFDGSWTLWETGLMDDIAGKTYDALAYHVQHGMNRNIKAVSLWSLQMTANAVLAALRNALDHAGDGVLNLQSLQALQAFAI